MANSDFMKAENQKEPPVGEAGLIYVFENPEDGEDYYVLWRYYEGRDKSQDHRFEALEKKIHGRAEINMLNDLYKNS